MAIPPSGLAVYLESDDGCYVILPNYYDALKDALDRNERGWREFDDIWGGKLFCRVQDIKNLFLQTDGARAKARDWSLTEGI